MSQDFGPRMPLLVTCRACRHVWPVIWAPCPMEAFGRLAIPAGCPSCHMSDPRQIVMASRAAGDLDRYVAQLTVELERARRDALPPLVPSFAAASVTPAPEPTP